MNIILLWVLIFILAISILFLTIALLRVSKKATYLSEKEKKFINFAIEMYINYAEELDLYDNEEHLKLVIQNLERIRKKLNKNS